MGAFTLADVQALNTRIIAEIDRVCGELGITYYLSEGTLLGAARHGGSIPWDDDADIAMPRASYEIFKAHANELLHENYRLIHPNEYGDNAFQDFIPHVSYLKSRVTDPQGKMAFYGGLLNHVHIDIFILDNATNDSAQQQRVKRLKKLYGLSWAHRYAIDYADYSAAQKPVVWALSKMGKSRKQTETNAEYDRISQELGDDAPCYFLSNTIVSELDRVYPKEWYAETIRLDYEGQKFCAPCGYEKILEELYGDWRQLPPEDKRIPEHYTFDDPYFTIED